MCGGGWSQGHVPPGPGSHDHRTGSGLAGTILDGDPRPHLCCRQDARALSSTKTFPPTHASPETRGEETTLFLDKGFWLVYQPRRSQLYISPSLLKVGLWLARTVARSGLRYHTHAHTAA